MAKTVFISYSKDDRDAAFEICGLLEERGVSCWIAPRDVPPGRIYSEVILDGIHEAIGIVLILSEHANQSIHVRNEVERAVSKGKAVFPVRIREVEPSRALELFVMSAQWVEAWHPPLPAKMDQLAAAIKQLVGPTERQPGHDTRPHPQPMETVHPPVVPTRQETSADTGGLSERLKKLREAGERQRAEAEEAERRRRGEEFAALQELLVEQLDAEAYQDARGTVAELLKLKPDDREAKEAQALIFQQLAGTGGGGDVVILPGGVEMEFVQIPPGTFMMGSPESEAGRQPNERPQHQVTIEYPFWLGKYPVTQAQWQAVMGTSVTDQRKKANATFPLAGTGPEHPMYYVSWHECQEFIEKVTALGQGACRLPSEAEWEYACRAGAQTRYGFGDNEGELGEYAWYAANSGQTTHPVGQKLANAWELYDMHGNVYEWCQDWYHDNYAGAPTDGRTWETPSGQWRVLRGGSWYTDPERCRSANRGSNTPAPRLNHNGFRVVRTP